MTKPVAVGSTIEEKLEADIHMRKGPMKLSDMMDYPLKELIEQCNVARVNPVSDDAGVIKKIIIEFEPHHEEQPSRTKRNNSMAGFASSTLL